MNPEQAAAAALAIRQRCAIPMHYGKIVGSDQQAADFKAALEGKINVHICARL
jgi:L-ascorbate metabolism protein UlaG (beta-lactamase superfamily)